MGEYRYTGRVPETLASGRPLASGESVRMGKDEVAHPHNKRLVDEGLLLPIPEPTPEHAPHHHGHHGHKVVSEKPKRSGTKKEASS